MTTILETLNERRKAGRKSLSVLIDPDKIEDVSSLTKLIQIANESYVDFFFVGGSLITNSNLSKIIQSLKSGSDIPVVLFPGSNMHIDLNADGILFLSLISGRNPDLLIGQHVVAAPILKNSRIEVLPTGYMLINSENTSSVSYMSNTNPIPSDKEAVAACTAMAGEMLGLKLIYMDAGSGAKQHIPAKVISKVRKAINAPLIIGGGINTTQKAKEALTAGADVIVIGNAAEKNPNLLIEVSEIIYDFNKVLDVH
ncbi:geranylgeranylglyceryl/heptaprenylglyceryl phosphate synthase [Fulvivirga sp. RKSG066]|uniref:geranylgeranylglyceryl/heptaprenylglyceryl phosphate synthase n=1 Tax=Fulvivirga aurantia TaxID=2529383 RepID=UPI0012BD571F|nr:geranylgeranylglyceryl/heptaprenylglyceryl phosphate synthase [Fulvivirga aurantia]MTI21941.1 geranylgeranylglyceryl/heptaprenylglyceryl phosphate synthase [Fulvivirga aurantia]